MLDKEMGGGGGLRSNPPNAIQVDFFKKSSLAVYHF